MIVGHLEFLMSSKLPAPGIRVGINCYCHRARWMNGVDSRTCSCSRCCCRPYQTCADFLPYSRYGTPSSAPEFGNLCVRNAKEDAHCIIGPGCYHEHFDGTFVFVEAVGQRIY
ncbi:hypothetical protein M758_4G098500 [Ceratodon purpureus]|nr:hypothetical protein M758_4G098500 [Ceratodon purpureus]